MRAYYVTVENEVAVRFDDRTFVSSVSPRKQHYLFVFRDIGEPNPSVPWTADSKFAIRRDGLARACEHARGSRFQKS
jgi:hypothetical protein